MKLSNADLAAALRQQHPDNALLRCFAQILIDRPTSKALNNLALRIVDLPTLPEESWSIPLPSRTEAELQLSVAIQAMNSEYHKNDGYAEIHARRVAWAAMTVARILEWQRRVTTEEWTRAHVVGTDAFYNGFPLHTAEGRAAVVGDVTKYLQERNGL